MNFGVICLVCFLLLSGTICSAKYGELLYDATDPILLLNSSNFENVILGKDNFWVVEFYNKWCGHCIRFAPIWKQFAQDIKDWSTVVKVAAIDCSDLINVELCRKYKVTGYPTIKLFKVQAEKTSPQYEIDNEHNVTFLRIELLEKMKKMWDEDVPKSWPSLLPLKAKSIEEMWKQQPIEKDSLLLIIEPPSSYIGEEVMLDLSKYDNFNMKIVHSNQSLVTELEEIVDVSSLPSLLQLWQNGVIKIIARNQGDDNLREKFGQVINPKRSITSTVSSKEILNSSTLSLQIANISNNIYMSDLENALNYSICQEVGVHQILKGEKLRALKKYLTVLIKYFPGRLPIVRFLNQLYVWILEQKDVILVENMMKNMRTMQSDRAFLPPRRNWEGCKGSRPGLRGYPCSLWTLFHTLTVQAFSSSQKGISENPFEVVFAIRGYVKFFFTCAECSDNFEEMASNLENELIDPEDTVLWLWKAHNKVNKRLASDTATNDPQHPKVQFPHPTLCEQCHSNSKTYDSNNPMWNVSEVLKFLIDFYDQNHIIWIRDGVFLGSHFQNKARNGYEVIVDPLVDDHSSQLFGSWKFKYFNRTDVSLCVMLYITSAMLLVILYFIFSLRRKRYKMQHHKRSFIAYP